MRHLDVLAARYPHLTPCLSDIQAAFELWRESFDQGNKTLICGNGGSAADSEHIVGELMKGFVRMRPPEPDFGQRAERLFGEPGRFIAQHLQGALPAISLTSQQSLLTAFGNDVTFDLVYAQQVFGYGRPGDVLVALSTSGNSVNTVYATMVAKLLGLKTIGFTGRAGGRLKELCDVTICVPEDETYKVQELHQAIYHTLCLMLEEAFFAN